MKRREGDGFHLRVGMFPICEMGHAYSGFFCGHPSRECAERELGKILKADLAGNWNRSMTRIVEGECPHAPKAKTKAKRAKYDEADVIPEGICCGDGCGEFDTLFRTAKSRYRCASCYADETGRGVPHWMRELARVAA